MEFDYENWNHINIANKIKEIRNSEFFHSLLLREQLYIKFYELFSTNLDGSTFVPEYISDIFEEFANLTLSEDVDPKFQLFYLCIQLRILSFKRSIDKAVQLIEKNKELLSGLELESKINDDKELLFILGLYYETTVITFRNDLNYNVIEKIHKCKSYWTMLCKELYYYLPCELELRYYWTREEFDKFIAFNYELLEYFTENHFSPIYTFIPLRNLIDMYCHSKRLDLKKAIQYSDQLFELLDNNESINENEVLIDHKIEIHIQRGAISDLIGDINASFFHYHEALKLCKLFTKIYLLDHKDLDKVFSNLGKVHTKFGNFDSALHFQLEALNLRLLERKNPLIDTWIDGSASLAHSYYHLIKIYQLLNNNDHVQEYFNKFKSLLKSENLLGSDNMLSMFKISYATILINNKNFADLDRAKFLLKEVVNLPIEFELIADSLPALIEILVQEYKVFQNGESLDELSGLSDLITNLYEKNNSIVLQINFLVLQGKLALVNGEIVKAESFYKESIRLTDEYHQVEMSKEIKKELSYVKKISDLNLAKNNFKERIDMVEIENYVKEAFNILKNHDSLNNRKGNYQKNTIL